MKHLRLSPACSPALALASLFMAAPVSADSCDHVAMYGQFLDDIVVCASSILPPQGANTYRPANLAFLGPRDQAWCEGSPGDGLGDHVSMRFRPNAVFQTVVIENGYQKNPSTFRNNNRVRHATLRSDDGMAVQFELADAMGQQRLRLPHPVNTEWLTLTIDSVWRGDRFRDTCITFIGPDLEEMNYQGLEVN